MPERQTTRLLWVLGGCGVLLLAGICVLAGIGAWLALEGREAEPGPEPPLGPEPIPPTEPFEPAPGPTPPDAAPIVVRATVTTVTGSRPVQEGATCGFTVERRELADGSYMCRTQVVCSGRLLYGGPEAGYFPCTVYVGDARGVVGGERQTSSEDGDASFVLDTRAGTVRIGDDGSGPHGAYALEAQVDGVR